MNYFIISFQVIIDSKQIEHGLIGSVSSNNDYQPNTVKRTVTEQYRKKFPEAIGVAVRIIEVRSVTHEDYIKATPNFIQLI